MLKLKCLNYLLAPVEILLAKFVHVHVSIRFFKKFPSEQLYNEMEVFQSQLTLRIPLLLRSKLDAFRSLCRIQLS